MSDLILQLSLFLSFGAIIFIMARQAPDLEKAAEKESSLASFFKDLPIHKYDALLASLAEKNLRKFRVALLKVDNTVIGYLNKVKSTTVTGNNGNLKDLIGDISDRDNSDTLA